MKKALGIAALTCMIAPIVPATAQEAPATGEPIEIEEVTVTGIRSALQKAAELKKDADQVVDIITAEDVGKLPDQNVAESLQRVTGVQITRVFGEGQSVNIRGLQQVRVEVDGRTLLGWSARVSPPENDNLGRSSGLDAVPSSLFGRLEVRKSPLASQAEGGLGGTVNLVTPKPFDFERTTISARAQGTYSDVAEEFEPTISGLFTTRLWNDRLGVLIAAEKQDRTSKLQLFERNNFFNALNGTPSTTVFVPRLLQYENVDIDRSREGINAALQLNVTPNLLLTADALYSRVEADRTNQFIAFNLANTATGLVVSNPVIENGYVVAGSAVGNIRTGNQHRADPVASYLVGFNGKYNNGGFSLEGDVYSSKGTLRQEIEVFTLQTANNAVVGTFDFRGRQRPDLVLTTPMGGAPFNPALASNYPARTDRLTIRANALPGDLEEVTSKIDVGYEFGNGYKANAGLRFVDLDASSDSFRSRANITNAELAPFLDTGDAGFLSGIPGNFPRAFLTAVPGSQSIIARSLFPVVGEPALPGDPFARNAARDYDLNEKTQSGYVSIDREGDMFGRPSKLNVGVRVSKTEFRVNTFSQAGNNAPLVPQLDENEYTDVLPTANFVVNVTDDFLVRLSGSKTLQRAGLADLAPSTFVDATNRTSTGGNAQLVPPTSTNFDVSFEYYTGGSSLFSGALFYKDVKDFIATSTTEQIVPGFESLGLIRVIRPDNVASAEVRGLEIGAQQFFDNLPSPFDGLGVIANYTFADSEDSNGFPLVATSKHSYNLIALYEKGPWSGRIAYNWRDDAVFEFTQGRPDVIAERSQLDAQLGFDISKGIALSFQAQNLFPQDSATVELSNFYSNAVNSYALSERRFSFGVRVKY